MRFSNSAVRHSSTKNFRRHGNLRAQLFSEHHSEPVATRLSSVEDVTATKAVHNASQVFFTPERTPEQRGQATKRRTRFHCSPQVVMSEPTKGVEAKPELRTN